MKNKKLQIIILVFFFIGLLYFVYRYKDDFLSLRIVNPLSVIPLSLIYILFFLTNGLVNKYLLKIFKVNLNFNEWFGLSVINTAGNYLTPFRGGSVSNALYLKKKHDFPYTSFISVLSATYIIVFWINSLIGLITIFFIKLLYDKFSLVIFMVFAVTFLSLTLIMFFSPKLPETKSGFLNKFIQVINSWEKISNHRKTILLIGIIAIVNIILGTAISYYEFMILGFDIPLAKLMILAIFSGFALLLSITPGSLGIKETFSAYSGYLVGIPLSQVITVSIIDRLISFLLSFLLSLYFSYKMINEKK